MAACARAASVVSDQGPGPKASSSFKYGGVLTDHNKPWWSHHAPAAPADASARIAAVSHPARTYPGVHETLDILTVGQYLQPTREHLPINRWVTPAEFVDIKLMAQAKGVRHCESGPLVRSSYHADEQVLKMEGAELTSPRK
jgi:lipoic acid synthetase